MIDFKKTFESDEICIRPLKIEDFEGMKNLTKDPDMWIYFTADLSNKVELRNWIESGINDKNRLALTIIDSKTNNIIGSTSIGNISQENRRVEIGWTWISKNYQGKGYNSIVKNILIDYCIIQCGYERVEFKTDVLNIAARKALKKIGLIEEGILRSHTLMIRNRRRDTIYYSILKDEWLSFKK